jgi:hypothetical protein
MMIALEKKPINYLNSMKIKLLQNLDQSIIFWTTTRNKLKLLLKNYMIIGKILYFKMRP